jgi:hypothetical protein
MKLKMSRIRKSSGNDAAEDASLWNGEAQPQT